MLRQTLMLVPVFVAGLIIGAWALSSAPEPTPALRPAAQIEARDFDREGEYERLEQMIDSLTEILNFEVAERRRLEEQLEVLTETVAALSTTGEKTRVAAAQRASAAASADNVRRAASSVQADEQRFIDAGFAPDAAAALKLQLDEIAMERLYLRDRAVREGWLGSARYRDELRALTARQNSVREELSPEEYDRFLYATGRPNRVGVNSVLSGSPADQSGLRAGDQILSYDGQRVFSPAEIRRETTRGERGALVPVEVLRDGRTEIVYLPRGPLGVQMGSIVSKP